MTNIPPNPTPGQLPPASTTNFNVHAVGAGIAARKKAGSAAKPVQESTPDRHRAQHVAAIAALHGAAPAQAAPQRVAPEGRLLRLSELAAAVSRAKHSQRAIAESGDPDGPDDSGYDPGEIVCTGGSRASVAASVVGAMQRRRQG